jgi:hypothetical protein
MFLNKKKKIKSDQTTEENLKADSQLNDDLIVHNMPSPSKLRGAVGKRRERIPTSFNAVAAPKNNFKSVGLFIIIGGLVFIIGLVYLSYRFIISPTAEQNNPPTITSIPTETKVVAADTTATSSVIIPNITDVSTVTPTILDSATTTATGAASEVMNEELNGKNISDLPPLLDSDRDGLNDNEELLLGTNSSSSDSNGNSYADLTEINNNYNPAGSGRLIANSNLATYTNSVIGYEILYPKSWLLKSLNNDATAIFTMPDDSLIQISVQDNPDNAGILSWYESSFPGVTVAYDKLKSTDTWDGVWGEDNLNFYLTDKKHNNIFVISYVPVVNNYIAYPNVFKLMINSLLIK